jgi:hypothetical protein
MHGAAAKDGGLIRDAVTLSDQYGTQHEIRFPAGKPVVFFVAGRKSHEVIGGWPERLRREVGMGVSIYGLGALQGVPGLFHGFAVETIRASHQWPVLLDWEGKLAGRWEVTEAAVLLVLVDKDGRVLRQVQGPWSEAVWEAFVPAVRALLR